MINLAIQHNITNHAMHILMSVQKWKMCTSRLHVCEYVIKFMEL